MEVNRPEVRAAPSSQTLGVELPRNTQSTLRLSSLLIIFLGLGIGLGWVAVAVSKTRKVSIDSLDKLYKGSHLNDATTAVTAEDAYCMCLFIMEIYLLHLICVHKEYYI